ncbi:M28 family metallopeptidase [Caldisalinibacter kiritimatiensis]|uniref:Putative aminopeptidase n=1 Tax=Caldisalinibacter kiritimatiensis TaxID=1304284 RepID=R1CFA3_9FIRM|nr:M28 family metallopeptidase [Caldisalinibacter kiritimatiensis]EOD00965.1 putative aminopeptidase [Caldisalinibacter kiritimatiensis]
MKKITIFILCILIVLISGCTFETSNVEDLPYNTVKIFTSDDLKGRLTGTEGNDKALEYLQKALEDIGLKSYHEDSYFHEYVQTVYHPYKQEHSFIITFEDNTTKECKYGNEYLDPYLMDYVVDCPVTLNTDDEDLKNRVIVLDEKHNVNNFKGKVKAILIKKKYFFKNLKEKREGTPIIQINDELYKILKDKKVKNVAIKSIYNSEKKKAKNVVGIIPGENRKKALVFSAHLDHVGWAGDKIFKGAVDNASGVAVLLDLSKRLKEYSDNNPLYMDIVICFFNGEESGLNGSSAFVKDIKGKYEYIYNINVDCVGMKGERNLKIDNDSKINYELVKNLRDEFSKYNISFVTGVSTDISDHYSFIENNICAINIEQSNVNKNGEGIHTIKDTIELVDFDYLHKVVKALYDFTIHNNGKTYNFGEGDSTNKTDIYSDMKLFNQLIEIQSKENLEYNKYKIIKHKDRFFQITGIPSFEKVEKVKEYYSDISFIQKIGDYELKNITIGEKGYELGIREVKDVDVSNLDVSKAYERNLSKDNIESIFMEYEKNIERFSIEISRGNENIDHIYKTYNLIPITVEGVEYLLMEQKLGKVKIGIYKKVNIDHKSYYVTIYYFGKDYKEINGVSYPDNNVDDLSRLIKQIDYRKLIKGLSI